MANDCEHDWEFIDDSFGHLFGFERSCNWLCSVCGEVTDENPFRELE